MTKQPITVLNRREPMHNIYNSLTAPKRRNPDKAPLPPILLALSAGKPNTSFTNYRFELIGQSKYKFFKLCIFNRTSHYLISICLLGILKATLRLDKYIYRVRWRVFSEMVYFPTLIHQSLL